MKRKLFLLLFILSTIQLYAQVCVPNSSLQPNQVDPNSEIGETFINGSVGDYYEDTYSIHVPASFDVLGFPINVLHIKFLEITGLPPGLTAAPNIPSGIWLAGTIGCVKISGTPTVSGKFDVSLKQEIVLNNVPNPIPLPNDAYSITISGTSNLNDKYSDSFILNCSIPLENDNPILLIESSKSGEIKITIHDIRGSLIYSSVKLIQKGSSKVDLDKTFFSKGIYVVTLVSRSQTLTRKFSVL